MKVTIIGCGKLGSGLAINLVSLGHAVTVIDSDSQTLALLGNDFKGKTMVGVGFDRDLLETAQIRTTDAVISCTKSDETNALIARISRNIYRVAHVIARLYDPRKAEIYRSLGIQTISPTTWGVQRITDMLNYNELDSVFSIGNSSVEIIRVVTPILLEGRTVDELTILGEVQVVSINRNNKAFLPTRGTVLKKDDIIYISVLASSTNRLKKLLGLV